MAIPKEIRNFVEFLLQRYSIYKEDLENQEERQLQLGFYSKERVVKSIETYLAFASREEKDVFEKHYLQHKGISYRLFYDLGMSRSSFYRCKQKLISGVAQELGLITTGKVAIYD